MTGFVSVTLKTLRILCVFEFYLPRSLMPFICVVNDDGTIVVISIEGDVTVDQTFGDSITNLAIFTKRKGPNARRKAVRL